MIRQLAAQDAGTLPVNRGTFFALILISVSAVLGGCGSSHSNSTGLAASQQLASIDVGPPDSSVPLGLNRQFTATGIFKDGSKRDISTQVVWASMNTAVASISTAGNVSAGSPGATTITASLGGMMGSTSLTVTPA